MSGSTVQAHFHGGPFDGEVLPVGEETLPELVALTAGDGGVVLRPVHEDADLTGLDAYRLSVEASGLAGDVEYAYVTPLTG